MYLKGLAKQSKSPDGCDSTAYGQGRASPSSFYGHHLASLSCAAIVFADGRNGGKTVGSEVARRGMGVVEARSTYTSWQLRRRCMPGTRGNGSKYGQSAAQQQASRR